MAFDRLASITTLGGLLAPMLGHDVQTTTRVLSAMAGRQLALFSLIIPAYLVVVFAGWRRMLEVWPAVVTAGASFAIGQFLVSNYIGPELTASLSALFSLASVLLLLRGGARARCSSSTRRPRAPETDPPLRVVRAYSTYGIPDRRARGTDRKLRGHVDAETAAQSHSVAAMRTDRQPALPGSVARTLRGHLPAGFSLSRLGVQLARRLSTRKRPAGPARAARAARGRNFEPVSVDLSSRFPCHGRDAGAACRARGLHPDVDGGSANRRSARRLRRPSHSLAAIGTIAFILFDLHRDELLRDDVVRSRSQNGRPSFRSLRHGSG